MIGKYECYSCGRRQMFTGRCDAYQSNLVFSREEDSQTNYNYSSGGNVEPPLWLAKLIFAVMLLVIFAVLIFGVIVIFSIIWG